MRRAIMIVVFATLALYISYPVLASQTVLNIGYQPSTHQIAEMVAFEKGWWQDELKPFGITEVKEFQLTRDEIRAYAAAILKVEIVSEDVKVVGVDETSFHTPVKDELRVCGHVLVERVRRGHED